MIYVILFIYGLALGSFVNALVFRIHQSIKHAKTRKSKKIKSKNSLWQGDYGLFGRSMCPHCKHALNPKDLIPLVSWLTLKGRCRYCHKSINWQYPAVELTTGLLFVMSYLAWPYGFELAGWVLFVSWLVLLTGLVALTVYDIKWMLLPNKLVYPLGIFWVVVSIVWVLFQGNLSDIFSLVLATIVGGGFFWILFQVSDGRWIGGGDVKLGFLLGLLAGSALKAAGVIFLSSIIGTITVLPFLLTKRLQVANKIPFGPFLIIAGIIMFLWGDLLVQWYSTNILLI
ncbi:MAG: prepilin peptidase [Candidatus Saccharibacteria bacterium]|nr:prepilin peptidase [Candidatus Saccharibacteria bacterium]